MRNRIKNPYFWIGIIGVVLTAMGVNAETFTTWQAVADALTELIKNPYLLGSVAIAVLGVFVDPSSSGLKDVKNREDGDGSC
ncbi:holin%2C phage phi LC3 family [uncultured Eubacterium sp.]|uniref:phage holin n=1 Tax=Emergencia sp. TaxID=1926557 RepID=UPI0008230FAA|nr:holin%2C phage phi LC3 family [uncultured Eubacterium sp.]